MANKAAQDVPRRKTVRDTLMGNHEQARSLLNDFNAASGENVKFRLISDIRPNPHQPRKYFDPEDLRDLGESIKQQGVLLPLLVRKDKNGQIELVAGERRLRAAEAAGLDRVPTILNNGDPLEVSIIENVQRTDLNPVEEAESLQMLVEKKGYSQTKLAAIIGKRQSDISKVLSINKLPVSVKDILRVDKKVSTHFCCNVLKLDSEADMLSAVATFQADGTVVKTNNKEKRPEPRRTTVGASEKIAKINEKLKRIHFQKLSETSREEVKRELLTLKQTIEELLSQ